MSIAFPTKLWGNRFIVCLIRLKKRPAFCLECGVSSHYSGPKGSLTHPFFFQKGSTFSLISSDWSVQLVWLFYKRKALDLSNVLHTHIDGIGCTEKILETSQFKISFQNHHFLHILALSQTGCQRVWKFRNRYVCTFGGLGCVLSMVWSRNFFLRKGMIPDKYLKA